jgi:hypothetical protein
MDETPETPDRIIQHFDLKEISQLPDGSMGFGGYPMEIDEEFCWRIFDEETLEKIRALKDPVGKPFWYSSKYPVDKQLFGYPVKINP